MLICFGTRPEYIKVKSLINNLPNIKTCFTGQHKDLLNNVNVDYHIEFKESFSSNRLNDIIIHILKNTYIFDKIDNVIVQGDTTTALAIALSAYNSNIKVIHLEAGLRTNNIYDPFPEELNRQLISRITNIHLCPTINNKKNLLNENIIESKIFVVGNTGLDNITKDDCEYTNKILITLHRRNNLPIIKDWFKVIDNIAFNNPNIEFILPIHPNPEVKKYKNTLKNVNVIEPLSHEDIIKIIKKCKFIISDSGGIQEEACFLNKKIIICRIDTERPEVLENHGVLCKTPDELPSIFNEINNNYIVNAECPFGDGNSYKKIIQIL
jgi:UDP-N-acetylglucosamine 2-epimerase (non-hydrolysing)